MRTIWAAIGVVVAGTLALAIWAVTDAAAHFSKVQARLAEVDSHLSAVERKLDAGVVLTPALPVPGVAMASSIPADSGGVVPPIPPDFATARTAAAQLELVAWTEAFCEALSALNRRDSLKRTAALLPSKGTGERSHWQVAMGATAAGEEIIARGAIGRAQKAKENFEAANK